MSIRIRAQEQDGMINVRALLSHPMHTGDQTDDAGETIPEHFIQTVEAKRNGETMVTAHWNVTISQNPFLELEFEGSSGDTVEISWEDNQGETASESVSVR
ncbi:MULTISPECIES: thiosulfate oxidation carrier complex protein SoxZ [unclassified Thioalkalivibrio]|uniref:thiosulfate oxidation carrier complex protein SoxZ n=1 Tax=unclassified Thioalkalivibrio TaxID=2621013 RepID=UPI000369FC57|nr:MULTISPECIES: thiosulfate oxidation carrier complex protein SoxZ [unclassified Thioalkalivibrio]